MQGVDGRTGGRTDGRTDGKVVTKFYRVHNLIILLVFRVEDQLAKNEESGETV